MSSRNHENNKKEVIKELEKTISPVLVINNPSLKPYVELFEYYPENIYQQPLGSLIGFFEIKEYSQDSAYIVNFLTSVLKKEYYINPKRAVPESLDSALHKVNLALSELANQGNVEWLGNLNAAICVLEKNNAHFSVTGKAKIFLYRNTILSDISDGLAADYPEPHPLKTFVNVSSGRLEKDDQMLITSEDIFHILSNSEIKKNFQRFKGEKFVQFLKTALSNQLELIASLVVQVSDAKTIAETKAFNSRKKITAVNVFSEKTFAKAQKKAEIAPEDIETIIGEEDEFIDKKTGHIYMQGEESESSKNGKIGLYWDITKEKIAQGWYSAKNSIKHKLSLYKKQLAKKHELRMIEKEKQRKIKEEELKRIQSEKALADMKKEAEIIKQQEAAATEIVQEDLSTEENTEIKEDLAVPSMQAEIEEKSKELTFIEKLELARKQQQEHVSEESVPSESDILLEEREAKILLFKNFIKKSGQKTIEILKNVFRNISSFTTKTFGKIRQTDASDSEKTFDVIPHFSKIKRLFSSFNYNQRIYAFLALVIIFIAPFFIVRWINKTKEPTITQLEVTQPTLSETLANEKNINLSAQIQTVLSHDNLINSLSINNGVAVIAKNSIVIVNNGEQKEYTLPENSGSAIEANYMKDLSLVFILTDQNKIISFSPVSTKFTEDNISLPENVSNDFIGTYLTYLYILDPQDNQIYRYPRATGGFGSKTNWLKDETSLSEISDMTIDDNIYCIQNNSVIKLFKGKKQDFSLENSNTPISFNKIFTNIDSASFYVLDTKNARIIQYNKADGTIAKQYFNEALTGGISLSVDETNKVAYITTSSGLISISIQ